MESLCYWWRLPVLCLSRKKKNLMEPRGHSVPVKCFDFIGQHSDDVASSSKRKGALHPPVPPPSKSPVVTTRGRVSVAAATEASFPAEPLFPPSVSAMELSVITGEMMRRIERRNAVEHEMTLRENQLAARIERVRQRQRECASKTRDAVLRQCARRALGTKLTAQRSIESFLLAAGADAPLDRATQIKLTLHEQKLHDV